jgi:uncharacterized membrane protein
MSDRIGGAASATGWRLRMEGKAGGNVVVERGEAPAVSPSGASRWIAAFGYVAFVCFFSLWHAKRDPFIRAHASQAVLLFIAECAAVAAAVILGSTIGRIKIAGLIVIGLFNLVTGLAALILSVAGFVKALFGDDWTMPFLGEYREKVPGLN